MKVVRPLFEIKEWVDPKEIGGTKIPVIDYADCAVRVISNRYWNGSDRNLYQRLPFVF